MELWLMSQALTDMTGYTCLHAVYTTVTHVCSFFVFFFCGVQNTVQNCLNLHIVILFVLVTWVQKVKFHKNNQNLPSFLQVTSANFPV